MRKPVREFHHTCDELHAFNKRNAGKVSYEISPDPSSGQWKEHKQIVTGQGSSSHFSRRIEKCRFCKKKLIARCPHCLQPVGRKEVR